MYAIPSRENNKCGKIKPLKEIRRYAVDEI